MNPDYPVDDPVIRVVEASESEIMAWKRQAKENLPTRRGTAFGELVAKEARKTDKPLVAFPQSRLTTRPNLKK